MARSGVATICRADVTVPHAAEEGITGEQLAKLPRPHAGPLQTTLHRGALVGPAHQTTDAAWFPNPVNVTRARSSQPCAVREPKPSTTRAHRRDPQPPPAGRPTAGRRESPGPGPGSPWAGYTWEQLEALEAEGRAVLTDHGGFVLINVYAPNISRGPGADAEERAEERSRYKAEFFKVGWAGGVSGLNGQLLAARLAAAPAPAPAAGAL